MSLTAAMSGFVVLLLSVQVIQAHNDWGVTYTSTEICAVKGSTVEIKCTYSYPSRINDRDTTVEKTFWFTKLSENEAVDVKTDSEYAGRVQYSCHEKSCTLRITDLRESDSAEYKFRFITNQEGGRYSGLPGVTLSVKDLQVQVSRPSDSSRAELKCHSSCHLPHQSSFIWYKNEQKIQAETSSSYLGDFNSADSYSCAVKGHEDSPSPSVYGPKLPSVSPSGEIVEGSSVTLTCSSDANPAANYTWYKGNVNLKPLSTEPQLVLRSIQSSDSGEYYCTAENELGRRTSGYMSVDVKYAPKTSSLSVSPSGEIVEGSSVTLTCSSDANPAANYTWYKENEDSPKASGQTFTITDIRAEHSGNYFCEAQNTIGRRNFTLHLIVVAVSPIWNLPLMIIIGVTLVVVMLILLLVFILWMRKKKTLSSSTEPNEPRETIELESEPDYENITTLKRDTAACSRRFE